jgi:hypothetical protein
MAASLHGKRKGRFHCSAAAAEPHVEEIVERPIGRKIERRPSVEDLAGLIAAISKFNGR